MKITKLDLTRQNEDGYTCEYFHDRFGQHLILFRKAGTISGRHYHKGNSLTKNPEILLLLSGTCTLNWRDVNSERPETAMIEGPVRMDIPPYCWHEIVAKTDCVFLELNSIAEHAADTYYDT